jgi:hypothetical protein
MDVNHSGYPRHPDDFYVEPAWCFDVLIGGADRADFASGIYDPCVGAGTIPVAARRLGLYGISSDIVDRPKVGPFKFAIRDFLEERTLTSGWPSIVMNPPFRLARAFVEKALRETKPGGVIAALAPLSFLASQARYDFFRARETERIIVLSKRPSLPDGDALIAGAVKRGNGKANYAWLIFRVGGRRGAEAAIDWGRPSDGDLSARLPDAPDPTLNARGLWPARASLFARSVGP